MSKFEVQINNRKVYDSQLLPKMRVSIQGSADLSDEIIDQVNSMLSNKINSVIPIATFFYNGSGDGIPDIRDIINSGSPIGVLLSDSVYDPSDTKTEQGYGIKDMSPIVSIVIVEQYGRSRAGIRIYNGGDVWYGVVYVGTDGKCNDLVFDGKMKRLSVANLIMHDSEFNRYRVYIDSEGKIVAEPEESTPM